MSKSQSSTEARFDHWLDQRQESLDTNVSAFTSAVMAEVRTISANEASVTGDFTLASWLPRPAFSSFCLVAGVTKTLLALQAAL